MDDRSEPCTTEDVPTIFRYYEILEKAEVRQNVPIPSLSAARSDNLSSLKGAQQELGSLAGQTSSDLLFVYATCKSLLHAVVSKSEGYEYLLDRLIRAASNVGEYREVIELSQKWRGTHGEIGNASVASSYCQILGRQAKAHRNLAEFEEALSCYREILRICEQWHLEEDRAFQLLMFGKMYGNYGWQLSLFRFFTELALGSLKRLDRESSGRDPKIKRYIAIALDSLGQIHGRSGANWEEALNLHREAAYLHGVIGNHNGVSRAVCHECMVRLRWDKDANYNELKKLFSKGFSLVARDPSEQRGVGVRSLQFAELLVRSGDIDAAEERTKTAKKISQRFRDYRTLVRAYLFEARISEARNGEGTYDLLCEAQSIARQYGLLAAELEVNQAILKYLVEFNRSPSSEHSSDLGKRTKEIVETLTTRASKVYSAVRLQQAHLDSTTDIPLEFERLTSRQRTTVLTGLVDDFKWLSEQANSNFYSLAVTLERVNRRAIDEAGMSLTLALVKALLHDYPSVLPDTSQRSLWLEELAAILQSANSIRQRETPDEVIIAETRQIIERTRNLSTLSTKLQGVQERTLSDLAKERWSPQEISMRSALRHAVETLTGEKTLSEEDVLFDLNNSDICLNYYPVWIERVIENLIRNAAQNSISIPGRPKIKLSISRRPVGDFGNTSVEVALTIANLSKAGDELRLKKALQAPGWSDRPRGMGIGIWLAWFILLRSLGGKANVYRRAGYTCLSFYFLPDGVRIRA